MDRPTGINHFCAVKDDGPDGKWVFVASIDSWTGEEISWTIRPTFRKNELTQGAPANWAMRPWRVTRVASQAFHYGPKVRFRPSVRERSAQG